MPTSTTTTSNASNNNENARVKNGDSALNILPPAPTARIEEEDFEFFDADIESDVEHVPISPQSDKQQPTLIRVATYSSANSHTVVPKFDNRCVCLYTQSYCSS